LLLLLLCERDESYEYLMRRTSLTLSLSMCAALSWEIFIGICCLRGGLKQRLSLWLQQFLFKTPRVVVINSHVFMEFYLISKAEKNNRMFGYKNSEFEILLK
jgi:hypothetical protein